MIFFNKKIRGIPKILCDKDLNEILKIIEISRKIEPVKWPRIPKHSKK